MQSRSCSVKRMRSVTKRAFVDNVVVRECCSLRRSRGAGRELDVDGIEGIERDGIEALRIGLCRDIPEAEDSGARVIGHRDHAPEMRRPLGRQMSRSGPGKFRSKRSHHAEIVRRLETLRRNQDLAGDLVERELEFGEPIGGIDVDEDGADTRRGELGQHPFEAVGRPDADAVALVDAEVQEARGKGIDFACQVGVAQDPVLLRQHDRIA